MLEALEQRWMDSISHDELRFLIDHPTGACVSVFLPLQPTGPERQQNPIRLEHALRRAETLLRARGLQEDTAQALLAPAWRLLEEQAFWEHQQAGVAIFVALELFRVYRLPVAFEELVIVDQCFHVTPLLPLLYGDSPFFVLALGLEQVRLYQGLQSGLSQIALPGVPAGLQDTLKCDEFAKQSQFHSGLSGRGGERGVIFHGQGARDGQVAKEEILRYFQEVDHSVHHALHATQAPLLLAGIAYLVPLYREANSYAHILDESIIGNPDDLSLEELHDRAWAIIEPYIARTRAAAIERYHMLVGTDPELVSRHLREILPAAHTGRVDILFVATGQHYWGTYDQTNDMLALHDEPAPGRYRGCCTSCPPVVGPDCQPS